MKKLFTFFVALFAAGAVTADNLVSDNYNVTLGDQLTTLEEIYEAAQNGDLLILQNLGNASSEYCYYAESTEGTSITFEGPSTLDKYAVVKLGVTRSGEEGSYTYAANIQSLTGQYYQGPGDATANVDITLGATAEDFTLELPTSRSASEFWFSVTTTVNSTDVTWHLNTENNVPKWHQPGTGNYSRTNVYKAVLTEKSEADYTALQEVYDQALQYQSVGYDDSKAGKFSGDGDALDAAITAAAAILADKETNTDVSYQTSINEAATALTTAIAGLTLNQPTLGKYYRIKSHVSGGYITSSAYDAETAALTVSTTADDAATIWYYGKNSSNQMYLLSYYGGQYINTVRPEGIGNSTLGSTVSTTGDGFNIYVNTPFIGTFQLYNKVSGWEHLYNASTEDGAALQHGREGGTGVDITQEGYAWYIEEVDELPVELHQAGDKSYATLYLPVAVKATVPAYTGTVADSYLDMTEVTDGAIPAETKVVLVDDAAATSTSVTIDATNTAEALTGALEGNANHTVIADWSTGTTYTGALALGKDDAETPGFYGPSDAKLGPNRAYIPASALPAGVRALSLRFGGEPTGITTATDGSVLTGGQIYDLQGRRVLNAEKGLYIVGGKKVLVK